jgi:trehalose-6-phosphate synthase
LFGVPGVARAPTFLQIAAPSRSKLRHTRLQQQTMLELNRISLRSLLQLAAHRAHREHQEPEQVFELVGRGFRLNSLHDGMNLVAKVRCSSGRRDGVLILSTFTGSRELVEALLVNPYDVSKRRPRS